MSTQSSALSCFSATSRDGVWLTSPQPTSQICNTSIVRCCIWKMSALSNRNASSVVGSLVTPKVGYIAGCCSADMQAKALSWGLASGTTCKLPDGMPIVVYSSNPGSTTPAYVEELLDGAEQDCSPTISEMPHHWAWYILTPVFVITT